MNTGSRFSLNAASASGMSDPRVSSACPRFSSSSAKARLRPSRPAKQKVIHRIPGARSVAETAVVDDAIEALKRFEGSREALATIYLTGPANKLVGAVPLVTIAISSPAVQLSELSEPYIACARDTPQDEVAGLFDKYNLLTLAVVDEHGRIAGIITADDVISMLRHRD